MRTHHREQPRALGRCARIELQRSTRAHEVDPLEDLLRRLGPVAWEAGDATVARRRLERLDRVDAELVVQLVDLRRAEAGDAQQVEQSRRRGSAQLLEIRRLAGLDQV